MLLDGNRFADMSVCCAFHRLGGAWFLAYANFVRSDGIILLECRDIGHADASYSAECADDGRDS